MEHNQSAYVTDCPLYLIPLSLENISKFDFKIFFKFYFNIKK